MASNKTRKISKCCDKPTVKTITQMNSYMAFGLYQKEGISEKQEIAKSLTETNFSGCIWGNLDDKDSRRTSIKQEIKHTFKIKVGKRKNVKIL